MYGAVDIGGTKTLVVTFSKDGQIQERHKFPTPKRYNDFLQELAKVVDKLSTKDIVRTVVAVPGLLDRTHGIGIAFGTLTWENVPLQEDVEKIFHCPIVIENDSKLAALSEAGLLKNEFHKVLYVTVSTGIGGGLIINGQIEKQLEDIEIGQMLLEHQGKLQRWEDFASGSAIVAKFGKRAGEITDQGDWYIIARNIALGLNSLIATLDPEVIVLGGGVGTHFDQFKDRLTEELHLYENPLMPTPPIRQAQRSEDAVIYGCYELAKERYGKDTGHA